MHNKMDVMKYKEIDYVIRRPENEIEGKKYPLVIYVHGAGGRGRDISLIENHCFFALSAPFLRDAISVAPQCYANSWFDIFEQLQSFIEFAISDQSVDPTRVYVLGASMGGYTTWQLGMARPELFAALVPICGGGMYWNAGRLLNTAIWAFHGDSDPTVFPEESKKFINNIEAWGGKKARLTILENTGHNAWEPALTNPEMWNWLLEQSNSYIETENKYDDVKKYG